MDSILLIEGAVVLVVGGITGYVIRHYVAVSRRGSIEAELEEKILQAKRDARSIEDEALTKASLLRDEIKRSEERVRKQEERLDTREQELIKRDTVLSQEITSLREKSKEMQVIKERIEEKEHGLRKELEKVASLSEKEAQDILFSKIIKEGEE